MDKEETYMDLPVDESTTNPSDASESVYNSIKAVIEKIKYDVYYYIVESNNTSPEVKQAMMKFKAEGYAVYYINKGGMVLYKIFMKNKLKINA